MSFKFHCTNCGQKVEAEAEHIGQNMSCPSCSQSLIVTAPSDTADHTPPPLEVVNWHYELDGNPTGPVPEHQIKEFIAAGKITRTTRVWCKGMTGWVNAQDSRLRVLFDSNIHLPFTTEQVRKTAEDLYSEGKKISEGIAQKSAPFIKSQVIPRIKQPRYVVLIICCLTFLYQCGKQQTIHSNIQYLDSRSSEINGNTFWHSAGTFFGIFSGDPGTAMTQGYKLGEDIQNAGTISNQRALLKEESDAAELWLIFSFFIGLIAALRIFYKHWKNKKRAKSPPVLL
jgi:DNA-directed RNA polymerase subunit RPC12/RpoP